MLEICHLSDGENLWYRNQKLAISLNCQPSSLDISLSHHWSIPIRPCFQRLERIAGIDKRRRRLLPRILQRPSLESRHCARAHQRSWKAVEISHWCDLIPNYRRFHYKMKLWTLDRVGLLPGKRPAQPCWSWKWLPGRGLADDNYFGQF